MADEDCVAFLQWAMPRLGLRWAGYRRVRGTVCKRLRRRLRALALPDLAAYRAHLEAEPAEWDRLDGTCRITISRFYRSHRVFDLLRDELLPARAQQASARGDGPVRCWSAGCASGEEPYSLRLAWDLGTGSGASGVALSILGTDADAAMLRRARAACYPAGALRELPEGWRERAFEPRDGAYCLRPAHRAGVAFACQDIRQQQPDGPFDLILCRNLVFLYFDEALQRRLLASLAARLRPGGLLVLGHHERLPDDGDFAAVSPPLPVYRLDQIAVRWNRFAMPPDRVNLI